jgi:hypothetical protein
MAPSRFVTLLLWFCLRGFLWVLSRFPFDPLEVEHKDRVKNRNQEQGDEGGNSEPADLGIAERFPEGATFESKRKQGKDRCANGDHHGRIRQSRHQEGHAPAALPSRASHLLLKITGTKTTNIPLRTIHLTE